MKDRVAALAEDVELVFDEPRHLRHVIGQVRRVAMKVDDRAAGLALLGTQQPRAELGAVFTLEAQLFDISVELVGSSIDVA